MRAISQQTPLTPALSPRRGSRFANFDTRGAGHRAFRRLSVVLSNHDSPTGRMSIPFRSGRMRTRTLRMADFVWLPRGS